MDIFIKLPIELQRIVMDKYFEIKHSDKMKLIEKELPEKSYQINQCFTINLSLHHKNFKVFHSNSKELYKKECKLPLVLVHQESRDDVTLKSWRIYFQDTLECFLDQTNFFLFQK